MIIEVGGTLGGGLIPVLIILTIQTYPFQYILLLCLLLSEVIPLEVQVFVSIYGNIIYTFHKLSQIFLQH